ncbi:LOW QUALITY PROTEIN: venom serine protease 34 [Halyomorpha halys]|uniref:LOW QUALITY PROTEIN: venom serine protease 34 n=1 Tax=Halyomorpha halys TaxID=286706 RepID=UPI0034D35B11
MKLFLVLAAIVTLSWGYNYEDTQEKRSRGLSCNCGWRNAGRIVGGKETRKNEYPWMVSISSGCGGSIISPWHILTAAHCIDKNMTVSVGRHQLYNDKNAVHYTISKVIKHEAYDHQKVLNDIAILVTSTQIRFNQEVGPICLWKEKANLDGKYVKVMGWGLTKGTAKGDALREVDLKVIPWGNIQSSGSQLCAHEESKDSCNGDSGGPLVYLDPETNRYTQVALVSYGVEDCGKSAAPSVNTNVPHYYNWIQKAISSNKPEGKICIKN